MTERNEKGTVVIIGNGPVPSIDEEVGIQQSNIATNITAQDLGIL